MGKYSYQTFIYTWTAQGSLKVVIVLNTLSLKKMANIFQITLPNTFSWKKIVKFGFKVHWSLFQEVPLTVILSVLVHGLCKHVSSGLNSLAPGKFGQNFK